MPTQLGILESLTLTLGDELNDTGGGFFTRLRADTQPRQILQSGAGLRNATSSDSGATVSISSGEFDINATGTIFRVLSAGTTVQETTVFSRNSATELTLSPAIGQNFTNASWELVTPASSVIPVETTLGAAATGHLVIDGQIYSYAGITSNTFSGIQGLDPDGEYRAGVLSLHSAGSEVRDITRNFSYLDRLRREFFVRTASDTALDTLGRNLGVLRPPAQTDEVFRAVLQAIAYTQRGTVYSIEQLLTAIFGADNFEFFEDLTGGNPVDLNNTCTVYVRGDQNDETRFAGKTYLDGTELVSLSTTTTGILAQVPLDISDVRLAPEPSGYGLRLIDNGTGGRIVGIQSIAGLPSLDGGAVYEIARVTAAGVFNAAIRPGDVLEVLSGPRAGQRATIIDNGGSTFLTLAGQASSSIDGPPYLRIPPVAREVTGNVFTADRYRVVRPISQFRYYRPSAEVCIEYPGDAGTTAFAFTGSGTETTLVTPASTSGQHAFLLMQGNSSTGTSLYARTLRITDKSDVAVRMTLAIDAASDITDYDRMQIRIGNGVRTVGVAFRRVSPNIEFGFVDTGTQILISGAGVTTRSLGEFFNLEVRIHQKTQTVELWVDGARVDTAPLIAFAASSSRALEFGHYAISGDTVNGLMRIKTLDWRVEDQRSLWNVNEAGGAVSAARVFTDSVASSPAFVAGDLGKLIRIKNFTTTNARGGCVRGVWEIEFVSSADSVAIRGLTNTWTNATFSLAAPGQIEIRDQPDAFSWPDIQGHSIQILPPHPDAGLYEIVSCVPPEERTTTFDARFGSFANTVVDSEYVHRDRTNVINVVNNVGAVPAWVGVDQEAAWRIVLRPSADAGPLDYELIDASTHAASNFTLRQNPSLYGVTSGEVVEVSRSTVLSAQLSDPDSSTIYSGLNSYNQYPFWLATDIGVAQDLLPLLTAAGVIPDFESLSVDDAGYHLRQSSGLLRNYAAGDALLTSGDPPATVFDDLTYLWDARDVTSGAAWIDRVSGVSVAWAGRTDITISSNQSTDGIISSAIGADRVGRAVRVASSSTTGAPTWFSTGLSFDLTPGQSFWGRALTRRFSPTYDQPVSHFMLDMRDSATGGEWIYMAESYQAVRNGGGFAQYRASDGSTRTAGVYGTPDTRGSWNLYDVFFDGLTNTLTYYVSGKSISVSGNTIDEITSSLLRLCTDANSDIVAMGFALGADAAVFTSTKHTDDVTALLGAIPA